MRFRVRFDPRSPLLLGTGSGARQVRESDQVIPGSAVVGALAREFLMRDGTFREDPFRSSPSPSSDLQQLLGQLTVSPLTPVPVSVAGAADDSDWRRVEGVQAPATARTCKHNPGFSRPADPGARAGDGVIDTLLHRIAVNDDGSHGETGHSLRCPGRADHRLERFRARVYRVNPDAAYGEVSLPIAPRTRVGLNRATETVEDRILFQVEPVEPRAGAPRGSGTSPAAYAFIGDGWVPDELWPLLTEQLSPQNNGALRIEVAVGGGRAQGYGWGELMLVPADDSLPSTAERLDRWLEACPPDDGALILPALLRSPWPLDDPARSPGETVLWSAPPPKGLRDRLTCVPELSALETEPWGGWSMAWGLPRTRRFALAAGSVVVFRLQRYQPDHDREPLLTWLHDRQSRPSTIEPGTGWITWCDPFHLDHRPAEEVVA